MRFLIFLFVVAMFATMTVTQDTEGTTDPSLDTAKYNPDEPIVVPKVEGADDDQTVCENGSGDGRATRACCLGEPDAPTPDGGFVRVYKCRKYSPVEPDCSAAGRIIYCCVSILESLFWGVSCRLLTAGA